MQEKQAAALKEEKWGARGRNRNLTSNREAWLSKTRAE